MRIAWERHGAGPPVLLIHGLGYARWGWEPVLPALAQRFDVLLFDNRGIGDSDAPTGPYSAAAMAADARQVLDEAGVGRAHVVGTSLGGMVAQELALSYPDRVDHLVLACTTPGGPSAYPMPEATVRLMAEAVGLEPEVALRRFVENALAPATVAERPELVEQIMGTGCARHSPRRPGRRRRRPGRPSTRMTGWAACAGRCSSSTGARTWSSTRGTGSSWSTCCQGLERFPRCGHLFFWEEPERFVSSVASFLEDHA